MMQRGSRMYVLAIIGALLVSFVAGNLAGHGMESVYIALRKERLPDFGLLAFTFSVIAICFAALSRLL